MDTVDFEFVNSSGDIIANKDPAKVKNLKEHIKAIGDHFRYPLFHNFLVLVNLIFETSHWTEDLVLSLDEPERIRNMSKLCKEMMTFGCSMIAETIGIQHNNALFQSLSEMQLLTKKGLLNFASLSLSKIRMESMEKFWNLISHSFKVSCEYIRPDDALIKNIISVAEGDINDRHGNFLMNNIWIQRFQTVIEAMCQNYGRAPIINSEHFQMVFMTFVAKNDFCCKNLKECVCHFTGLEVYHEIDKHHSMPPPKVTNMYKNDLPDTLYWSNICMRAGTKLSYLFADEDLTLLFRLLLLFQQLPQQDNILKTLESLLKKKVSENKSLQCYQNGSDAINAFMESIDELAKSSYKLVWELSISAQNTD